MSGFVVNHSRYLSYSFRMMVSSLTLAVILPVLAFSCWRLLRRLLFPTILDNLPGPPSPSFWTGSLHQILNPDGWHFHQTIAETYGGVIKTKGLFGANNLYVFDPKALHHVLVKDQAIYEESEAFLEGNRMLFGEGLFTSLGERHRLQRKMLNPAFSITHIREMVGDTYTAPVFYEATHRLRKTLAAKVLRGPQEIDVIEWTTRLALELIGQGGLGYSFDALAENSKPHEYGTAARKLNPLASQALVSRNIIIPLVAKLGTPQFRKFLVDIIPWQTVTDIKNIVDVLYSTSIEIFESKRKAMEQGDDAVSAQIGHGKDLISILMRVNMDAADEEKLSDDELLGQITNLTFAATDTTSGALCRTFHVLAHHKSAQGKLREEIRAAREKNRGEDIDYDALVSLPFLDAVCRETLRLYPPVSVLQRTTRRDTVLPLASPIKGLDGVKIQEIPVPNGTDVFVSLIGCNRNREYWGPDAYDWKPERWLNPLPDSLVNARIPGIYSHLMTFLAGGRSCIGFKFSHLEMKVVLAVMLENFEFSLSDKEIFWQMNAVAMPSLNPQSPFSALPMKISLAKKVCDITV